MPSRTTLAAARRQPIGEHDGVDRAGARSSDAFEMQGFLFEQAVEHAPGERAVTAVTLQRQVHNFGHLGSLCSFAVGNDRVGGFHRADGSSVPRDTAQHYALGMASDLI
jgi:hypothetical protein